MERKRRKMKTKQAWDFKIDGFKFKVIDEDYDFCNAMSIIYKYTKRTWKRALEMKEDNERDYVLTEYDCSGSTEVRIKVRRHGNHIRIYYYWSKDV